MRRLAGVGITLAFTSACLSAAPSVPAAVAVAPPSNSSPPTITGAPVEGRTLTALPGTWTATAPISYAYAWLRCDSAAEACKPIQGAIALSYRLTGADAGHRIQFEARASAKNIVGAGKARSKPTAPVAHSAATINGETELFLAIALGFFLLVALVLYKLLIGFDGRVSTSKTVAAIWTYLLASALLGFVMAKFAGYPQALDNLMHSGLEGQYGLLIGGPLGAAIAAKGIVGKQVAEDPESKTKAGANESPNPSQLIQNDNAETDLGDFQYVLFNFVAMVYFVGAIFGSPAAGLPHIPDVMLALTSVGAVGYVAKKTLPNTPPKATAKLDRKEEKAGGQVAITGKQLLTGEPAQESPVLVVIAGKGAKILEMKPNPGGEDWVEVEVPGGLTAGKMAAVALITPDPERINAGELKIIG